MCLGCVLKVLLRGWYPASGTSAPRESFTKQITKPTCPTIPGTVGWMKHVFFVVVPNVLVVHCLRVYIGCFSFENGILVSGKLGKKLVWRKSDFRGPAGTYTYDFVKSTRATGLSPKEQVSCLSSFWSNIKNPPPKGPIFWNFWSKMTLCLVK